MECSLMSNPEMNIHFVDVEEEFDKDGGHQAYSSDPWINEIIFGAKNEDLDDMGFVSSYSIHPNASGAEAYARCVNAKIEEIENEKATLEFNGHFYKFYNSGLTWAAAKKFCEDQGGNLAVITSAEENDAISQFLAKHGSKNCYWIGIYSDDIEQGWKAVTGEAIEYTNWSSGEPNNQEGQEMYVHVYGKQDPANSDNGIGEWNDASVNGASYAGDFYNLDNFGFICEYGSEDEENVLEFGGHQYKLYNENSMTWEEAKAFCEEQGGHLVTITSADEQDAIYQYAKQFDVHSDIWIGISDVEVEGDWSHWITGEEVTFTNWGTGEPDNYQDIEQDYGVICMEHKSGSGYDVQPGQWDDIAANGETASGFFICEWE